MKNACILIIGYVWPEPKSSAAGSRMMQLIEQFQQQNFQIHFASAANTGERQVDLSEMGITPHDIEINNDDFDTLLVQLNPSLVVFDRYMIEEQFGWRVAKHCPKAIRFLNTEDLHCLRHIRHQGVKSAQDSKIFCPANLLDKVSLFSKLSVDSLAQREIAAIFRSDLSLMTSEFEVTLLNQHFQLPLSHLLHLPLQYSQMQIQTAKPELSFQQRQHCVFIGNFRHEPNWDAVLQLKSVWPEIRKGLPGVELHIYGAYQPKKAHQLHNQKEGFVIKGWAKDAYQVLSHARLCLAPIRFGAGIKGKLAESMACGTPSITTPIGAEAMLPANTAWPGEIVNDPGSFINATIEWYRDEHKWQTAHQTALQFFQQNYQLEQLDFFEMFFRQLSKISDDLDAHRQGNFIGNMLNHHLHKSTHYMALWIAEKNKPRQSGV